MAEWLKAHAWKACKGATLSRVRIPPSPPLKLNLFILNEFAPGIDENIDFNIYKELL